MKENNDISAFDSVFRQQLENASATPPAGVWEGIASSMAASTTATVATTAIVKTAIWVKIGIGVIAAAAISTVVYLATGKQEVPVRQEAITNPVVEPLNKAEDIPMVQEQVAEEAEAVHSETETPQVSHVYTAPANTGQAGQPGNGQKITIPVDNKVTDKSSEALRTNEVLVQMDNGTKKSDLPAEPKPEKPLKKTDKAEKPVKKTDSIFKYKYEEPVIPNVLTADGDGINDTYLIDIKGEEWVKIMIYDVNMNTVFETNNKNLGWNPVKLNGEEYPEGTYIVKVTYKFPGYPEHTPVIKTIRLIR